MTDFHALEIIRLLTRIDNGQTFEMFMLAAIAAGIWWRR
jgi:hypothetical protein